MTAGQLLHIVHDDDDLLVVDKPAGLVCHPTKQGEWSSLIGRVRLHLGNADGRLVNRLDRETSGVVVLAKRADVARELGGLFVAGRVSKTYLAIVHGHVAETPITIEAPIGKDIESQVAIKGRVDPGGARAETLVRTLRTFVRGDRPFSLLEVRPRTGRKHQIRIHLAHIGHPLVGDKLYGADEGRYLRFVQDALTLEDRRALILPHHALHAAELSCVWRERDWMWEAPAPVLFNDFLAAITSPDSASEWRE